MKTRFIIAASLIMAVLPQVSDGQVGNLLKNKAAKVINAGAKTLGKEIDKEIDTLAQKKAEETRQKAWENAEQSQAETNEETAGGETRQTTPTNQRAQTGGGMNFGGILGGKVTLNYKPSYTFNNRMYMEMEMYDKKDVVKMDYFIYFSDNSVNAGFESKIKGSTDEGEQVTVTTNSIFDGENKVLLLLSDMGTMKMGIISEVPDESTVQPETQENSPKPVVTKTGNSRVIAGYKCDEYIYREAGEKEYGKMWVTKDLKLKGDGRVYSKAGLPSYFGDPSLEGAAVLAMESYDDKEELVMKSETKEINLGYEHVMSTQGYSLRQMNFNQAGSK